MPQVNIYNSGHRSLDITDKFASPLVVYYKEIYCNNDDDDDVDIKTF